MIRHVCADCLGRFHTSWAFLTHPCNGDDREPDREPTPAEEDRHTDRETAYLESVIHNEGPNHE